MSNLLQNAAKPKTNKKKQNMTQKKNKSKTKKATHRIIVQWNSSSILNCYCSIYALFRFIAHSADLMNWFIIVILKCR